MARWTGHPSIGTILGAAEVWRDRCLAADESLFAGDQLGPLWTLSNLEDLIGRYADNPITGDREFLDKFEEQLRGAPDATMHLAAEALWLLFLFPDTMLPETKRQQIQRVWSWAGDKLPDVSGLTDEELAGVGNPGAAYMTLRPAELEYLLRTVASFKRLPAADRGRLLGDPWEFAEWLAGEEGSDRRLFRNALLYFLFPDSFERNTSRSHREQIYEAFKTKLPDVVRLKRNPNLIEYDRAILEIRQLISEERGTDEFDFYQDDLKSVWFTVLREKSVKEFTSWLNELLSNKGLQLNQCGRDIKRLDDKREVDLAKGFWKNATFVTSKPPRWLLHFDVTGTNVTASVPDVNRAGVIGFANTQSGSSGALTVRILPVLKRGNAAFEVAERWEWLLLFCFPGGLKPGSSGEAFENFDPATGVLTYQHEGQPYIFSGLLALNSPDDKVTVTVNGTPKTISYREATEALQNLLKISPATAEPTEAADQAAEAAEAADQATEAADGGSDA